ncbi:MAG: SMP-30/gluconolactonase/LRE family protein [Solirubrobacterales bacterium]|nr:SMP-30/gluconolactonase/LRE family protein [Solirubrobacterales bacterium]
MPESPFDILDERFETCVKTSAHLELHFEGCRWAEGPVYLPASRHLLWSDVPSDRMLRWDEMTGQAGVFRQPSGHSNGNAVDETGRLVTCEQAGRRVTRTEYDGSITVIADRHEGRRFNSPNDVVVRSDGSIWFTDPTYGIDSDYEGHRAASEIGACHVYRVDAIGACTVVADDFVRPNGLAFSPDERRLYVSDTGASHVSNGPRHIRVFDVDERGALTGGAVFADCTVGAFDGFRLDDEGRIWTSAGDGVHCYDPDGTLIGKVRVGEVVANVAFGGPKRNRLFICATTSLYSVLLPVNGAPTAPQMATRSPTSP